ncbi:MAG TPA: hypothetical protein VFZ77_09950 [Acidimicrobiales bacterium]
MADRAPETNPHADEQGVPARRPRTDDPEVPEADALEQSEEWVPGGGARRLPDDPEVPEADAWEQSQEVPFDDEEPA